MQRSGSVETKLARAFVNEKMGQMVYECDYVNVGRVPVLQYNGFTRHRSD